MLDRRAFLKGSAGVAAGLGWAAGCTTSPPLSPELTVFHHGVASGDPLQDRVVLWTRVTPPLDAPRSLPVRWEVAYDPAFEYMAAKGSVVAGPTRDYTVKVDAVGLAPATTFYYRFLALGSPSPIGRTRTLPNGPTSRVRLAFCSCASLPWGYFNAYAALAKQRDLDAVAHLGDYLYEHPNGVYGDGTALGRIPEPNQELLTLADYRTRHAQYKGDPDLQAVHRQHPFFAIWDDHELANDAWREGAQAHDPETQGSWDERRRAALRAYLEWMPVRETGTPYRRHRFGDLVDLLVLDTRSLRDQQVASPRDLFELRRYDRSLLGADQEEWLFERLGESQRDRMPWRVLAQQVMFAPLRDRAGFIHNRDAWDGYPITREKLLDAWESADIRDNVILTGDLHSSWAVDVVRDPFRGDYAPESGRGVTAVEFVTPGITSPSKLDPEEASNLSQRTAAEQPHVRWTDFFHRGYALLDVDRSRAQCEWYHVDTVEEPVPEARFAAAWRTTRGGGALQPVEQPSLPRPTASELAP